MAPSPFFAFSIHFNHAPHLHTLAPITIAMRPHSLTAFAGRLLAAFAIFPSLVAGTIRQWQISEECSFREDRLLTYELQRVTAISKVTIKFIHSTGGVFNKNPEFAAALLGSQSKPYIEAVFGGGKILWDMDGHSQPPRMGHIDGLSNIQVAEDWDDGLTPNDTV